MHVLFKLYCSCSNAQVIFYFYIRLTCRMFLYFMPAASLAYPLARVNNITALRIFHHKVPLPQRNPQLRARAARYRAGQKVKHLLNVRKLLAYAVTVPEFVEHIAEQIMGGNKRFPVNHPWIVRFPAVESACNLSSATSANYKNSIPSLIKPYNSFHLPFCHHYLIIQAFASFILLDRFWHICLLCQIPLARITI